MHVKGMSILEQPVGSLLSLNALVYFSPCTRYELATHSGHAWYDHDDVHDPTRRATRLPLDRLVQQSSGLGGGFTAI